MKYDFSMEHDLPSDTTSVRLSLTDLSDMDRSPRHVRCGLYLACISGQAVLSTGAQRYDLCPQTELIFLTGSLVQRVAADTGFCCRVLLIPTDVFLKAMQPIDTPYFDYAHEHPHYVHTPDERSQKTWRELNLWFDMGEMLFERNKPDFRRQLELNYTQSLLMWLFNTIPEKQALSRPYSRTQTLCHRFMQLIREHGSHEHQVNFYADRLCISPRYLNRITAQHMAGKTPKQLIDEQLVAEAKVLLAEASLTITEIAHRLNFMEQSHLTRFFKKATHISPTDYRRTLQQTEGSI